jgi:hypothetical protein
MTMCVISQPRFFPGLHYLHRMLVADVFVILDTVQFTPRHEENRAKLKSPQGSQWLTVPVRKHNRKQTIVETKIDNSQRWQHKALNTINALYGKAPNFSAHSDEIADIFDAPHEALSQLDQSSWRPALRDLGVSCQFVNASELPVSGEGPQLLLNMCKHLGASVYLTGALGKNYLDTAAFAAEGVSIRLHQYTYPVYAQRFGEFVPFLSYLDMLFNIGLQRDEVLAGGSIHETV